MDRLAVVLVVVNVISLGQTQPRGDDPLCMVNGVPKCVLPQKCRVIKSCISPNMCSMEAKCLSPDQEPVNGHRDVCQIGQPVLMYSENVLVDAFCGMDTPCPEGSFCNTELIDTYSMCCRSDPARPVKQGVCPVYSGAGQFFCLDTCGNDGDCRWDHKCCQQGCRKECTPPESVPTNPPTVMPPTGPTDLIQPPIPTDVEIQPPVVMPPSPTTGIQIQPTFPSGVQVQPPVFPGGAQVQPPAPSGVAPTSLGGQGSNNPWNQMMVTNPTGGQPSQLVYPNAVQMGGVNAQQTFQQPDPCDYVQCPESTFCRRRGQPCPPSAYNQACQPEGSCTPCPQVMCYKFCGNGYAKDAGGCSVCQCNGEQPQQPQPMQPYQPAQQNQNVNAYARYPYSAQNNGWSQNQVAPKPNQQTPIQRQQQWARQQQINAAQRQTNNILVNNNNNAVNSNQQINNNAARNQNVNQNGGILQSQRQQRQGRVPRWMWFMDSMW